MVVGGCCVASNVVELVSLDPEHPVPDCLLDLNSFPFEIHAAAGASFPVQGTQYCQVMSEGACYCIKCTKENIFNTHFFIYLVVESSECKLKFVQYLFLFHFIFSRGVLRYFTQTWRNNSFRCLLRRLPRPQDVGHLRLRYCKFFNPFYNLNCSARERAP
jgi:hypothetical protein